MVSIPLRPTPRPPLRLWVAFEAGASLHRQRRVASEGGVAIGAQAAPEGVPAPVGVGGGEAARGAQADRGVGDAIGAGAAKIKIDKIYHPPKSATAEILSGSTDEVVSSLVGKIKELGLL